VKLWGPQVQRPWFRWTTWTIVNPALVPANAPEQINNMYTYRCQTESVQIQTARDSVRLTLMIKTFHFTADIRQVSSRPSAVPREVNGSPPNRQWSRVLITPTLNVDYIGAGRLEQPQYTIHRWRWEIRPIPEMRGWRWCYTIIIPERDVFFIMVFPVSRQQMQYISGRNSGLGN